MVWNNTTNIYEIDSFNTKLQRILNQYNQLTGSNFTLDEITNASLQGKGSGIQAVLYTYLQDLAFIESGILDIQAKLIRFIVDSQVQINRPLQMKDNIKAKMLEDGLEVVLLDNRDNKITNQSLSKGLWIITKDAIPQDKLIKFADNLQGIVAGVEMNGDKSVSRTLLNNQVQTYRYTEATKEDTFKVKLRYTIEQTYTTQASIDGRLQAEFLNAFKNTYQIGNDFNIKLLEKYLYPLFPELAYLEIQHSVSASNYKLGVYEVPYNKYLDLILGDIVSEEI